MAKRLTIDGYGQIELNNCAFRRDGRIEAQCAPDTTNFSNVMVENGMLLSVDRAARKVCFATDSNLPVALNYSAEHIYDERTPGLKNFALKGDGSTEFLPRLGYLSVGDLFTTNCVSYDTALATDDASFKQAVGESTVYAGVGADGSILCASTRPSWGPVLKAVEKTTMPDGQFGIKFQVIAC